MIICVVGIVVKYVNVIAGFFHLWKEDRKKNNWLKKFTKIIGKLQKYYMYLKRYIQFGFVSAHEQENWYWQRKKFCIHFLWKMKVGGNLFKGNIPSGGSCINCYFHTFRWNSHWKGCDTLDRTLSKTCCKYLRTSWWWNVRKKCKNCLMKIVQTHKPYHKRCISMVFFCFIHAHKWSKLPLVLQLLTMNKEIYVIFIGSPISVKCLFWFTRVLDIPEKIVAFNFFIIKFIILIRVISQLFEIPSE